MNFVAVIILDKTWNALLDLSHVHSLHPPFAFVRGERRQNHSQKT